jgi:hypothetical protein
MYLYILFPAHHPLLARKRDGKWFMFAFGKVTPPIHPYEHGIHTQQTTTSEEAQRHQVNQG